MRIERLKTTVWPFGGGLSSFTSSTDWMVTGELSARRILMGESQRPTFTTGLAEQCAAAGRLLAAPKDRSLIWG